MPIDPETASASAEQHRFVPKEERFEYHGCEGLDFAPLNAAVSDAIEHEAGPLWA